MAGGRLCAPFVPYPYAHPDRADTVAMFQIRARVEGDPTRTKHVWARHGHNDWRMAEDGKPTADLADRLLFRLSGLRKALRRGVPLVMWAEGEKDAGAAGDLIAEAGGGLYRDPFRRSMAYGPTTSHPFGAGKATPAQAAHFDGYRGQVLIAVDDDDAGAACGLRRYELLRAVGLRERQLVLVRAADEIGGGFGNGLDIADHGGAGYGLRELVRLRPGDLDRAAGRAAQSEQQGWVYGGPSPVPDGWAPGEWAALVAENKRMNGGVFRAIVRSENGRRTPFGGNSAISLSTRTVDS